MRILVFGALYLAGVLTGCTNTSPISKIETASSLSGDPVLIRIENAPSIVRITAERSWGWNQKTIYRSTAVYESVSGSVDVSEIAPVSGSYSGVSSAGLFWSMKDTGEPSPNGESSETVRFDVDFLDDGTIDFATEISLKTGNDRHKEIDIGPELPGAFLYLPTGVHRPPVVIAMGGSEGGDRSARRFAAQLASRGYAVLGLPYYSPAYGASEQQFPNLPRSFVDIPVDKVEIARDWLRERDDVDAARIGLYGISKGAEFALVAASKIEGFKAVVAIVPSDVIWEGWGSGSDAGTTSSFSWRGHALPFVPYYKMDEEIAKYSDPEAVPRMRTPHDAGRTKNPDAIEAARIRVEFIDEPVFLVGGDEDDVWASGPMSRNIKTTRDEAGLYTELYVDRRAGHYLSGDGYAPMLSFLDQDAAADEARLRVRAWASMLAFLDQNL